MKDSITVRDIETTRYFTDEYVVLSIYILSLVNEEIVVMKITAEVHLVQNLKAKLLVDVDVLDSEGFNLSFCEWSLALANEEWKTSIHIHIKNNT